MDNAGKPHQPGSGIRKIKTLVHFLNHATTNDARNVCRRCGKIVYLVELWRVNGEPYHKNCLTCKMCNSCLSTMTCDTYGGELYCTYHLREAVRAVKAKPDSSYVDVTGPSSARTHKGNTRERKASHSPQRCHGIGTGTALPTISSGQDDGWV